MLTLSGSPDLTTFGERIISIHYIYMYITYFVSLRTMSKGLIIPSYILLSDKNPSENLTKNTRGLLPRMFWSHFRDGFLQAAL